MPQTASGLGLRLQQAREARGLTIAEVSAVTRISARAIEAMERERFHQLPGGIFRRSYVQSYADAVGLDGPECARLYVQHFEDPGTTDDEEGVWGLDWPHQRLAIAVATALAAILSLALVAFAES